MNLFYSQHVNDKAGVLDAEESLHVAKVLRKKEGDIIYVTNGLGSQFQVELTLVHPKGVQFQVTETIEHQRQRKHELHLAVAPLKNMSRFEWVIEKAVEIGVDVLYPLQSHRTEKNHINLGRLEKIMLSAAKQSLQFHFPSLKPITTFKDLMQFEGSKLIAHCNTPNLAPLWQHAPIQEKTLLLIGPEGDFTVEEVKLALENNFKETGLGTSRLRTETAAIVAITHLNALCN